MIDYFPECYRVSQQLHAPDATARDRCIAEKWSDPKLCKLDFWRRNTDIRISWSPRQKRNIFIDYKK